MSSNPTFDVTGKMVQVEVAQAVSQAGWSENMLKLQLNANNTFLMNVGNGNLLMRSRVNGVNDQTSILYDSVAHRHWRIRHDAAANNVGHGGWHVSGNNKVLKKITFAPLTTTKIRVLIKAHAAIASREPAE